MPVGAGEPPPEEERGGGGGNPILETSGEGSAAPCAPSPVSNDRSNTRLASSRAQDENTASPLG